VTRHVRTPWKLSVYRGESVRTERTHDKKKPEAYFKTFPKLVS